MRVGLIQMSACDDPAINCSNLSRDISTLAAAGADFICTPEVSNCVSINRAHQNTVLATEDEDRTLSAMRELARTYGVWLSLGSLALKSEQGDGRFVNRSFLVDETGAIVARYDKIHMFDVKISETEAYCESAGYCPGDSAVLAATKLGKIGLTICYDMRFPALYNDLAQAGAQVICVPSAFTVPTGYAHFEPLLRARAIETGCYIIAACQTGEHNNGDRQTWGHSTLIDPWGEVLLNMGPETGTAVFDIDLKAVDHARSRIPNLLNQRAYKKP